MISILLALISIFPISFFFYACSERMIALHESRVGKQILFSNFIYQTWMDALLELKMITPSWMWLVYLLQFSFIFIFDLNVEYLIFIYLALNGFVLVHLSRLKPGVANRVESDRSEVRYAVAVLIASLCIFGCFTLSKSTSFEQIHWNPIQLFFVIPFQLSGMILFSEHPFQGMSKKVGWIGSARFYAWSMLCSKLFLGGSLFFIDLHIKAAALYLVCRILGVYFPRYYHKDLVRICILYLFPITGLIWLLAVLINGIIESGVQNV